MVKLADAVPVYVETKEENNFKPDPQAIKDAITDKTKAIIINSPSNPTGMVYTREELQAIADIAVEKNIYVISDEIYEHLIYEGEHVSIASLNEKIKALTIVINGVSKTYAMTGWRIGYAAAAPEIAKIMANIQSHASSNPNSIAQEAARAALEGSMDEAYRMKRHFGKRRDFMVETINSLPDVSCPNPHGAFYLMMSIKKLVGRELYGTLIKNADDFAEAFLRVAKVAVVPCTGFGAPEYVRWSYATSMDNIVEGLERLKKFLAGKY